MPGALGFRDALHDAAVFQHDVMCRHVGARRAKLRDRAFHIGHAGVMEQDHVGQAALVSLAMVHRRDDVGGDRGIRGKRFHARARHGNRKDTWMLRMNSVRGGQTKRHWTIPTGLRTISDSMLSSHYSPVVRSVQSQSSRRLAFWPCAGESRLWIKQGRLRYSHP